MKRIRVSLSRTLILAGAVLGMAMLGADCQGNIVNDPTFRDWCGNTLCSWTVDYGQIQRVPTWTEEDFGVAFLDNGSKGTQISQVTQENQATCILFTSVGDIDPGAQMSVGVDFNNDGTIDQNVTLGSTTWHEVQAQITAPPAYDGITFYVTKAGTGTAILAEMRIQSVTGCTAPAPDSGSELALGEYCSNGGDCASRICSHYVGDVSPDGGAESLAEDAGVCALCSSAVPCAGGATCASGLFLFPQCGPGEHLGIPNAACVTDSDCQSGKCEGAYVVKEPGVEAGPCDFDANDGLDASAGCVGTLFGPYPYVHAGSCM
jgi:hypothetical protein